VTSSYRIAVLPGDGIGPDTVRGALAVLETTAETHGFALDVSEHAFGGNAIDAEGDPFPPATREACLASDAVLKGAVGGPRWDMGQVRPEQGILGLRSALGAYANLRPAQRLTDRLPSPVRHDLVESLDLIIVRELIGGLYFGERHEDDGERAFDGLPYSVAEVERVARRAFQLAERRRGKVTSVDKANILATSRLWRRVVSEVAADYPEVEVEHQLVDSMAMKLIEQPAAYDVIVTENLFGDILSDLAASVAGGIGLASSASVGGDGPGLFEAVHGSAPDIAGTGRANPAALILSAALMLDELGEVAAARAIEAAVRDVLNEGPFTPDLGGSATTDEMAAAIAAHVAAAPAPTTTQSEAR
jgi:3-isopropylmalate dehydrogenase